ncbi:hypothetical protein FQR65_LT14483 [Abscondita terminalis]|nr:hypothetical protein FQR65_LT14483 [Abscondita terminalis]
MDKTETNYLSNLPDELKVKIFYYLDTVDIVQLEDVCDSFSHLAYDKKLISTVRLYKDYRCNIPYLRRIVGHKLRHNIITSLNINCVYWISRAELKKCLKLPQLECLYAVDTKLGIDDLMNYDLEHLHTLAITLCGKNFLSFSKLSVFCNLKRLYMHYDIEPQHLYIISIIIQHSRSLEELWFIDLSDSASLSIGLISILDKIPPNVKKVTMSFHGSYNSHILKNSGFNVESFKTLKTKMHLCLDKNRFEDVVNLYDESFYQADNWKDYIVRLKCDFPFGIKDAQKLVFKEATLENILWEELNLSHQASLCSTFYRSVLDSILLTSNSRQLKKLSVNTCLGQPRSVGIEKSGLSEPLFKKLRKAPSCDLSETSTLQDIVKNSPFLEELEIWECKTVMRGLPKLNYNALSSIKDLGYLRKLTLCGVPNYVSPKYLLEICQNCSHLNTLRLSSTQQNVSLNNYMCISIPHAKSLKDLRFEQATIPVCRIVESFCQIQSPKLERLVLKCNELTTFEIESFQKFVTHNPQLRFFCLCVKNLPKNLSRDIKKMRKDEQIFVVNDGRTGLHHTPVPYLHRMEMYECNTNVSTLDVFNGFVD